MNTIKGKIRQKFRLETIVFSFLGTAFSYLFVAIRYSVSDANVTYSKVTYTIYT